MTLLELGIRNGGSMLMWRDYFAWGRIAGLDINPVVLDDETGRTKFYQGSQDDIGLLERIAAENAPHGFDIIIDDCSHIGELTRKSFEFLFNNHLKSGGVYVIEDWGTGYWDSWPDGHSYQAPQKRETGLIDKLLKKIDSRLPSHDYGMVGFIKGLVDECGMEDITNEQFGIPPPRASKIEKIQITPGLVFVVKSRQADS